MSFKSSIAAVAVSLLLFSVSCSSGAPVYEKNMQATKVTGGLDEKNLEQAKKMEEQSEALSRVRDSVEAQHEATPEEFPPTR